MSNHHDSTAHPTHSDDSSTVVGHPDAGVVAGPSQWKQYAAAGAFVALLAGGVTYGLTRDGGETGRTADIPSAQDDRSTPAPGAGDDVLIGDPASDLDDLAGGPESDVLLGGADVPPHDLRDDFLADGDVLLDEPADDVTAADDLVVAPPVVDRDPLGLRQMCFDVQHQPVVDQGAASGIWVQGELYGLEGGWIWIEGPSINNGEGVAVPVTDGGFDAPLGINSYGDHEIERFELRDPDGHPVSDLLPQLGSGPGATITVGPGEGSPFDEPCFDFEPFEESALHDDVLVPSGPGVGEDEIIEGESPTLDPNAAAETFFDDFAAHHVAGDSDALIGGLYPPMRDAFGPEVCDDYIRSTTGSVTGATVNTVGDARPLLIEGPNGVVDIPQALPVQVDLILTDGTQFPNDANLVIENGQVFWLTQCGR